MGKMKRMIGMMIGSIIVQSSMLFLYEISKFGELGFYFMMANSMMLLFVLIVEVKVYRAMPTQVNLRTLIGLVIVQLLIMNLYMCMFIMPHTESDFATIAIVYGLPFLNVLFIGLQVFRLYLLWKQLKKKEVLEFAPISKGVQKGMVVVLAMSVLYVVFFYLYGQLIFNIIIAQMILYKARPTKVNRIMKRFAKGLLFLSLVGCVFIVGSSILIELFTQSIEFGYYLLPIGILLVFIFGFYFFLFICGVGVQVCLNIKGMYQE